MFKGKISLRQALLLFLVLSISPSIRLSTTFASLKAKQAGWLVPLPALITLFIMLFILNSIYKKYNEKSLMEVIYDIFGIWIGKCIVFFYFLWTVWLIATHLRYNGERIVGSIFPNIPMGFFLIVFLLLLAYILPKGITVIGRMSEVIFLVLYLLIIGLCLFLISDMRLDNIIPISTQDVIPIFKGSMVTTAIGSYIFLLFFLGEFIIGKEKLFKSGLQTIVFYVLTTMVLIIEIIGTLSSSVVSRIPFPFFIAVKQISILDTIEKIESMVVAIFIFSDFILLSFMIFVCLNMIKSLFKLKDTKYLLNILLVFFYFLALGITLNRQELAEFSYNFLIYINCFFGVVIPILIFVVGKIRKKI